MMCYSWYYSTWDDAIPVGLCFPVDLLNSHHLPCPSLLQAKVIRQWVENLVPWWTPQRALWKNKNWVAFASPKRYLRFWSTAIWPRVKKGHPKTTHCLAKGKSTKTFGFLFDPQANHYHSHQKPCICHLILAFCRCVFSEWIFTSWLSFRSWFSSRRDFFLSFSFSTGSCAMGFNSGNWHRGRTNGV